MEVVFDQVVKKYDDFVAVEHLNLTIQDGALHFLLGPSGCGKTTSLRMLAGLESVSSGRILFAGQDVTKKPAAERGIGMVFQNYALWPHMTVGQNIEYGLKIRKLSPAEIKKRLDDVLEITQLSRFIKRFPGQLSGGQQQRVALARALAIRPHVLLLDEPLSNLDAKLRLEMRENISKIHRETGITTLYVTHDQKEALSMGTHITVMHAGKEIQTGSPRELYLKPRTPFLAAFIGETNLIPGIFRGEQEGYGLVETKLGLLRAGLEGPSSPQGRWQENEPVCLSIRPEAIKVDLGRSQLPHDNPVEVIFQNSTYLGDLEQIDFRYGDNNILKVNLFNAPDHKLRPGDKTSCFIKPSKIVVLPPEQDMGPGT